MKWIVRAVSGKHREQIARTFVSADTEERAKAIGRAVIGPVFGIKGRFFVTASIYRPECDIAFRGYLRAVT